MGISGGAPRLAPRVTRVGFQAVTTGIGGQICISTAGIVQAQPSPRVAAQDQPGPCLRARGVWAVRVELCILHPWDPGRHSPHSSWPSWCLSVKWEVSLYSAQSVSLPARKRMVRGIREWPRSRGRRALVQCHHPKADLMAAVHWSCRMSPLSSSRLSVPFPHRSPGSRLAYRVPLHAVTQHPSSESFPGCRLIVGTVGRKASRSSGAPAFTNRGRVGGCSRAPCRCMPGEDNASGVPGPELCLHGA